MLSIAEYSENEKRGKCELPNRVIQAFGPVSFDRVAYPCRVEEEAELIRYVDVMHELKGAKYFLPPYSYSLDEATLIREVSDTVIQLTAKQFGASIRPWMAPLAAVPLFRAISAVAEYLGKRELSVFEIGPGSGYLGALVVRAGHRYGAMDNAQAFYLWQNRLYESIATSEFVEMAADQKVRIAQNGRVVHVPWWLYSTFHEKCPVRADVVVCDHALAELSRYALKYVLRVSKMMLADSGAQLLLFTSPGSTEVTSLLDVYREFRGAGYVPLLGPAGVQAMTLPGSTVSSGCRSWNELIDRRLVSRMRRRLFRKVRRLYGGRARSLFGDLQQLPVYAPSLRSQSVRACEFLPALWSESPRDYRFLSFVGERVPAEGDPK